MVIYPAIDLYGGKAVRLYKGDYAQMTVYSEKPEEVALDFKAAGATHMHLVDLVAFPGLVTFAENHQFTGKEVEDYIKETLADFKVEENSWALDRIDVEDIDYSAYQEFAAASQQYSY